MTLKLAQLPDRAPVKVQLLLSPQSHQALLDYAELYRKTYGVEERIEDLIPAMLSAFLDGDRGFQRQRRPS